MEEFGGLLLPLLLLVVFYLLLIRPQQKRRKQQHQAIQGLEVGDDIVTIGGMHARVIGLDETTMDLEVTADSDVVLRFERSSLGRIVRDEPSSEE